MKRSYRLACSPAARKPAAVVLLVLLAQVTACQPDPTPAPGDPTQEQPTGNSPEQPTGNTPLQTSPFSLTSSAWEPDTSTEPPPPPGSGAFLGVLTTDSALGTLDFRYDAYVVTARESGKVIIQADVVEANPKGYRYGYGYPLSMASIEDGVSLTAYGGSYLQNALETGTAIIDYPIVAGRQYILVYKTFGSFTPLTYRLTLPSALKLEGQIYAPPEPVPAPPNSAGPLTLENPRPDVLRSFVPWLDGRVSGK